MEQALKSNVEEVYVIVFDKQPQLIDLLTEYGFKYKTFKWTINSKDEKIKENIYVKSAIPNEEYYPFVDASNKKIFYIITVSYDIIVL